MRLKLVFNVLFFAVSNLLLKFFNKVIFCFVSVLSDLDINKLRLSPKSSIILFNMVFNSFFSTLAKVNDADLKTTFHFQVYLFQNLFYRQSMVVENKVLHPLDKAYL